MEAGAFKLLESATQRTLHAHAFTRSSNQASLVLTDLLSRYLSLLTSTCAKYAQHSGRTTMNVRDAAAALEELGLSLLDLNEYCATEGKELNRYALYSARRVEDLLEFKAQLAEGLRQEKDDAILLEYTRCPTPLLEELDSDGEETSEEEEDVEMGESSRLGDSSQLADGMDVDPTSPSRISAVSQKRPQSRPSTPLLPLSPISNPSSPKRKRPRRSDWEPPDYIPDFLPPFPSISEETPGSPMPDQAPTSLPQPSQPTLTRIFDAAAAMTLSQSLTTAAASDFLVQVPYSQSSLAAISEWHLPSALPPPAPPVPQNRQNNLPTLQLEHSLLGAYHHILTHPPPRELPPLNPSRHKVAMALIKQGQANPRYNPADTLFGSVAPCPPRVATIGPTFPVPIGEVPSSSDKGKEKDVKLPQSIPRPVSSIERIAPFITQQTSQIPSLALRVLPPAIHSRTSRLSHPPVLYRGSKAVTYGPGIPAPWNSNLPGQDGVGAGGPLATKDSNAANGKDGPKPLLPDARLYATWDYDTKDFRVPLVPSVRTRSRMSSLNVQPSTGAGTGLISLPVATRTKATK